ncbi:aldehyde dehydrogenase [Methanoculleus sp. FWC-SCC1]|uniref:Aldehyde dehydrogenase n=1 Tax=Methanoculleus frigidifontis TaxID=2584085 RepID=A0ABT8M5U6_9EURY|nr:aldehyde dehydrogenase family protein [Methanoculleus sp. FWC-SCC1]MDN7023311.1 aldehyde dehydrogenase [Methanoculleus sp. FWC-SCC1]
MQMLIDGNRCDSCSGQTFAVRNPATGTVIDTVPLGGVEDIDRAVEAGTAAFEAWSTIPARERGRILFVAAQEVRRQNRSLGALLTAEQGKPLREAIDEINGFAYTLEYYHGIAASNHGEYANLPGYGHALVSRVPLGVCAAIIPWNMPALIMGWKVGPALAAGNTMILKPASTAPLTCLALAGILGEAGLPAGVLNIVTGPGETVGRAIARHPAIRKISFTGEIATGRRVMEDAAPAMKRVTLELGGSDPMIVCSDADIPAAVEGAARGRFYNCGQTCTAIKRLYVDEKIAQEFTDRLTERIRSMRIGSGMTEGVAMGPMNNRAVQQRIVDLVEAAREGNEGTIRTGGSVPHGEDFHAGYFYEPTLITDVPQDSVLLAEEVFGPVLPAVSVTDLDEALSLANKSRFGLGASVWTKNLDCVDQACSGLKAGIIWVNQHLRIPPEVPFGGMKESGLGRENGYEALEDYLEKKTVLIRP